LQALALETLASDPALDVDPATRMSMIALLARASGSRGMAGGQAEDLDAEGRAQTLAELEGMHAMKTGALIRASVMLAAETAGGLDAASMRALARFGEVIGLAFQVRDDILDVVAGTEVLGKPQGSDARHGKSTFPALLGLDGAKARVASLKAEALDLLLPFGDAAAPMRWLAGYIVDREY